MKLKSLFLAVVVLFASLPIGCNKTISEQSKVMTESAVVDDLVFTPENHSMDIIPAVRVEADGNVRSTIDIMPRDIPERYAIVFECVHGKFIVQSDQEKTKALYKKLKKGQKVTVSYFELYETVVRGDKVVTPKHLVKYKFINAE
jgi:hypothetical protein